MSGTSCEEMRASAAELALGTADGEERGRALEHMAGCPQCRAHLRELAEIADELLVLAPAAEPPAGFEGRVSGALAPAPARRRSLRPRLSAMAAVAAAALTAAATVWFALSDDRELAGEYREALAVANGEYFEANHLEAPGGESVGYVYGYEGRTSWVLAVLYDVPDGRYSLEATTPDEQRMPLTPVQVEAGRGTAGGALSGAYDDVTEVRLLDERGREVAAAELGASRR